MNEPAMHVRIINPDGSVEATSSLASFVKNNEHDADALLSLGSALVGFNNDEMERGPGDASDALAHHWTDLGAGGAVGLVIVDGPCPREPSPDDYVCSACGSSNVVTSGWLNANTGEADEGPEIVAFEYWCHDCERRTGYQTLESFDATKAAKGGPTDATT